MTLFVDAAELNGHKEAGFTCTYIPHGQLGLQHYSFLEC